MNPDLSYESSITDESKLVIALFKNCEEGQAINLKKDLEYCFSSQKLDIATRRCLKKATLNRRTYSECVNLLLVCVDVNYRNPIYENSTIFMFACTEGNFFIIEQICNFDFSLNNFKSDLKLNLNLKDNNERNFLHYLLNSQIQEDDAFELISRFVDEKDFKKRYENKNKKNYYTYSNLNFSQGKKNHFEINVKEVFDTADVLGFTPLSITLTKGWFKLSKFLIMIAQERYLNKVDLNNYLHYAIIGKSLDCLNLILKDSLLDDVRQKNKDGYTPAELAKRLEMFYFSRLIENFEEKSRYPSYFDIFLDRSLISPDRIFDYFIQENYKETQFLLEQLNTLKSINEQTNFSLSWNIILAKIYLNIEKEANEDPTVNSFKISPENILSKFLDNNKDKKYYKKQENTNFLKILSEFFNSINPKNTPANVFNNNDVFDILILNKGIFYLKIGDDNQTIKIFWDYYKYYLEYKHCKYYKWIVYVNITFLTIEILIRKKFFSLVNLVIKKLEEFLFTGFPSKKDHPIDKHVLLLSGYLDSTEIINNYTETWDESFCLLNLYKGLISIDDYKTQESKIYFKEYKKLYDRCSYKNSNTIFETLHNFYNSLKIKMFYYENNLEKCFKILNKIYKLTKIENINLTINDKNIKRKYRMNPYILFYLNTLGIMYIKQGKYSSAEYFLKTSICHFKKIWSTVSKLKFDFSIKLTDIFYIKYNLALCYFYQKKYKEAYSIYKEIIKNKDLIDNIFIFYRIGICLIEIELNNIRKLREDNTISDFISKASGYANASQIKKIKKNENLNKINILTNNSNKTKNNISENLKSNSPKISKSKSKKNSLSPNKNTKERDESWDTVKFLNENLKDTVGITSLDLKAEYVVNRINQKYEDLDHENSNNILRRRIILQNNIITEKCSDYNDYSSRRNSDINDEFISNIKSTEINEEENNSLFYSRRDKNIINFNKNINLSESIYCFKRIINFYKDEKSNSREIFKDLNIDPEELSSFFINKEKENGMTCSITNKNARENNLNKEDIDINSIYKKKSISSKSFNSIINNSYMNLIFCLILEKNWIGALEILKDYERLENLNKDKFTKLKINNYLVEIYINLNQADKALEIVKQDLKNENYQNEKSNFYSSSINKIYNEISFKMMLYNNIMKCHLMNDNIKEADKCLTNILEIYNFQSIYDVPPFLINHLLYLNIIKGNIDIVLNLIKFKRINLDNLNPIPNVIDKTDNIKKN